MKKITTVVAITILQTVFVIDTYSAHQSSFRLRILHNNDMHCRFEEISGDHGECRPSDLRAGRCYGGFARVATIVRKYRNESMFGDRIPTIYLNAGDTYYGPRIPMYSRHKWKVVAKFMNILQPNVACLGNHEFDNGLYGLIPYLDSVKFPIVAANLDWSKEPRMDGVSLQRSKILVIKGRLIGVVGYLTPETQTLTRDTGEIKFYDEIQFLKREVRALKSRGVNIIIGLGHSGFERDLEIAKEVEGLDLIVGGHTHTFLYGNGPGSRVPDRERSKAPYPSFIVQPRTGKKVYIVHAYAYTKYMGKLYVDFNNRGQIIKIFGCPILLDSSVKPAPDVLNELRNWK